MQKYLFLDIDGVLNDLVEFPNGRQGISWVYAQRLNRIIDATDSLIVVSSSWRYDVLNGNMTLVGFERMLMRFGVDCDHRLVGITEADHVAPTRGDLISWWLAKNTRKSCAYVILDDGDYWIKAGSDHGIRAAGHEDHFVQTDGTVGLTEAQADQAIAILNRTNQFGKRQRPQFLVPF